MRAACKLGAEVREFAGTLVKVSTCLCVIAQAPYSPFTASLQRHVAEMDVSPL